MKESIGSTQLFGIVVTLVVLFAGIMAFAINRTNSFTIKDKLINIIEKHNGFDLTHEISGGIDYADCDTDYFSDPLEEMVCSLQDLSYRQTGKCPESGPDSGSSNVQITGYQRNGAITTGNNESSFCIVRYSGQNKNMDGTVRGGVVDIYYYKVIVFYHLDIPVVRSFFTFKTMGETKALYN